MPPQSVGYLYALAAFTIFAVQDGISKHLGSAYPPIFVTMLRYWAFAVFVIILALRSNGGIRQAVSTNRFWLQASRGVILAVQIVLSIISFSTVGLAHTHSILASTPLIVAALSVPLLNEQVGWKRWSAILVGFLGVLVILKPDENGFDPILIVTFAAAFLLGLYGVLTRLASRTDKAMTSFFYTGVPGAFALTLVGPFYWVNMLPYDWGWMLALCITGMSGHYMLIRAFEFADAASVQPFSYYQLVLVSIVGVSLYGEVLSPHMVGGAAIVIAAGLFTIWREQMAARRKRLERL
ncbi:MULTISPECIES: DMT family transporter [Agrobacterium]|uniref:DMT family transporter n=1 Tax=Agrobacterium rosae TaxID=1972867 RepID=A0AAE5VMN5_9HYPH|nr:MULTISPECIES: DMT family transporter [Agrobacterium]KAA3511668.1 DMT family transporter [Agrobacterium rosae]KAA3518910.1 DMT family transporter [Agrobacterium rosae]MBN7806732.1 DMT family transporter [Agrobacterium rosae]MCM2435150.1 DMT family transporter [Agrobacterium rosae]MDX8304094.1 DMT family transporter [Agrobacterium rosae]